jgi:outer membrane lipoprotein carrier protein
MIKFLLVLFVFCSSLVNAADDDVTTKLRELLDAMNSLQGNFVQTIYDKQGAKQDESSGEFMLMRPGKFYWKTTAPLPQLLVSNNKTIWLYDPDLETVNQREFTEDLRETPALLLSADAAQLQKQFSVSRQSNNTKVESFTLTPKVTKGLFQYLTLVFTAGQLSEFSVQDSLGQTTRCELKDVKRNQPLPEEKFYFIPPQGVEITVD